MVGSPSKDRRAGAASIDCRDARSWSHLMAKVHLPMNVAAAEDGRFSATLRSRLFGDVRMSEIRADAHTTARSGDRLADENDRVVIAYQLAGGILVHEGGLETAVRPGDLTIYDGASSFAQIVEPGSRALLLQLPRAILPLPPELVHRRVTVGVQTAVAFSGAVAAFFEALPGQLERLQGWSGARLAASAVELASAAIAEHLRSGPAHPPRSADFVRACTFIEENLPDPQLRAESIATAIFVSLRQLYKIFHAEGTTVARWITERRLEECRLMLADPRYESMTVGEIGAACGIFDRSQLSRSYRQAYGASPREHRLQAIGA